MTYRFQPSAVASITTVDNDSEFQTIAAQDETDFDGVSTNGTFTAGADYEIGDAITLSDGTVATIAAVDTGGEVLEFDITSATTPGEGGAAANGTLSQASTSGAGSGFDLTLGDANETEVSLTQQLLPANTNRKGVFVNNTSAADLLLKYGEQATPTSFGVQIVAGTTWWMPDPLYQGRVDGVWDALDAGSAIITEL